MAAELIGLLHDIGGILGGLVEHEGPEQAFDLEADVLDGAAALFEQLREVRDGLLVLLGLEGLVNESLRDLEVVQGLLVPLVRGIVGLDRY